MFVPFELSSDSNQQTTCKSLAGAYDRWARYRHQLRGACPLTGVLWFGCSGAVAACALQVKGWGCGAQGRTGAWLHELCVAVCASALLCSSCCAAASSPAAFCTRQAWFQLPILPPPSTCPSARKFPLGTEDAVYALADSLSYGGNSPSSSEAARLRAAAMEGQPAPRKQNRKQN